MLADFSFTPPEQIRSSFGWMATRTMRRCRRRKAEELERCETMTRFLPTTDPQVVKSAKAVLRVINGSAMVTIISISVILMPILLRLMAVLLFPYGAGFSINRAKKPISS